MDVYNGIPQSDGVMFVVFFDNGKYITFHDAEDAYEYCLKHNISWVTLADGYEILVSESLIC